LVLGASINSQIKEGVANKSADSQKPPLISAVEPVEKGQKQGFKSNLLSVSSRYYCM
jgi:hypothetical protein